MTRWILVPLAFGLAGMPSSLRAQAAIEYGAASSHSAVATSGISRALNSKLGQPQQGPRSKSVESAMEENRKQVEPKNPKDGGAVHIESAPAHAVVYVDGWSVGYTPADLTLTPGKHDIELKHPVSVDWEKEITVKRGDKLSLKQELKDKYKSVLSFTVQQ